MIKLNKIIVRVVVLIAFLLVANQIYRFFLLEPDLQEHSDLINLVREVPDSASVLYVGESSNFTFGDYDINTKRISDLIAGYYPDLSVGTISHGALHAGNFRILLNRIPAESQIETVIVTLNLRSFNPQWIDSKLETSLAKSMVLLKNGPSLFNRSRLSFKAYDIKPDNERQIRINKHWENDEVFLYQRNKDITINQWTKEVLATPDSIMKQEQRQLGMHYIRTYAFEIDTLDNIRIRDFDKIVKLAEKRNWNLVFNLLAENTEKANELVGPDLVAIMKRNAQLLESRYSEAGVKVVNNLESVSDPSYLDRNWTTEHYDETGRKIIAYNVALALKDFFPSYFANVQYRDDIQKAFFFNDCEGGERWFQMNTCNREQSYSGSYSSKINRDNAYSVGFTRPVGMIPRENLNRVKIDFYYYQPYPNSSAQVVLEIRGGEDKPIWLNNHISKADPPIGSWFPFSASFNIPKEVHGHKLVKLYVWNPGKEPAYIDDIRIQFE